MPPAPISWEPDDGSSRRESRRDRVERAPIDVDEASMSVPSDPLGGLDVRSVMDRPDRSPMFQSEAHRLSQPPVDDNETPSLRLSAPERVALRMGRERGAYLAKKAAELGLEPAVAGAVLLAQSSGRGFGPQGRLKIRFERHIFASYAGVWIANNHADQEMEYVAFEQAKATGREPAFQSIAMGAAQLMGFHARPLGYHSAEAMFDAMARSENAQLDALFAFVAGRPVLLEAARQRDWCTFARHYNGRRYARQGDHERLQTYYAAYQTVHAGPATRAES